MPESPKKEYFPPKIIHTEPLTGRASTCLMADDINCAGGPLQS